MANGQVEGSTDVTSQLRREQLVGLHNEWQVRRALSKGQFIQHYYKTLLRNCAYSV